MSAQAALPQPTTPGLLADILKLLEAIPAPVKPCVKCGGTQRYKPRKGLQLGKCVACEKALSKAWYEANREYAKAKHDAWRKANLELARAINRGSKARKIVAKQNHRLMAILSAVAEEHAS